MVPPSLAGFLSGYFHEDWHLEFADWREAVDRFRSAEAASVEPVRAELGRAMAALASEAEAAQFLRALGCYHAPAGSTLAWLTQLHTAMGPA